MPNRDTYFSFHIYLGPSSCIQGLHGYLSCNARWSFSIDILKVASILITVGFRSIIESETYKSSTINGLLKQAEKM